MCEVVGENVYVVICVSGIADRRPKGGWLGSEWATIVTLRIRSVGRPFRGVCEAVVGR